MSRGINHRVLAVGCGVVAWLSPSQSMRPDQIVALVDARGHKVYVNTGEPSTRLQWMSRSFRGTCTSRNRIPSPDIERLVQQTSYRFQVDPDLVHAIIKAESAYDPKAMSNKGAMGLMQLIPATAQRFGVANPFDPRQNIEAGVTYLKHLLDLFGGDLELSLAAYNAGEHRVLRKGAIPAIPETREYVRKVKRLYRDEPPSAPKAKAGGTDAAKIPVVRYIDEKGTVHYTNVY
jgi:soluble lytic murein transglycosylase-like protein